MEQVSATVDDEARESFLTQEAGKDVDEVALSGGTDVDHQRTARDERCAVASYVLQPARSGGGVTMKASGVRSQGIGPVIAEQFQVAPDQRIHRAPGAGMQSVIQVEEFDRVLRESEAPALVTRRDPRDQR